MGNIGDRRMSYQQRRDLQEAQRRNDALFLSGVATIVGILWRTRVGRVVVLALGAVVVLWVITVVLHA